MSSFYGNINIGGAEQYAQQASASAAAAQTSAISANISKNAAQASAIQAAQSAESVDAPELTRKILSAFPTKFISKKMITFDDGADDILAKTLTLNIKPHQEGSDDPSPNNIRSISGYNVITMTRTGKNLAYIPDTTLTMPNARNINLDTPIDIPIGTFTVSITVIENTGTKAFNIALRNKNNSSTNLALFTIPAGRTGRFSTTFTSENIINRAYAYLSTAETDGAKVTFTDFQIEAGSNATEFVPFYGINNENLMPVYDVSSESKNGITLTNNNGIYTLNGTSTVTTYFDIPLSLPNGMYLINAQNQTINNSVHIYLVNSFGVTIQDIQFSTKYHSGLFNQDAIMARIRIVGDTTLSNFVLNPIIMKAEFYDAYNITIPTDAGTVYGGSLTVDQDGSGTLTVDRGFVTFDGTEDWREATYNYILNFTQFADRPKANEADTVLSDRFVSSTTQGIRAGGTSIGVQKVAIPETVTSLAEWKTWLASNNTQCCYLLETPQTYTLTAEQVTTLLGDNTLWMDADGSIDLEYRADTQMYIDNCISALNANLAYIEDSMTASRAYSVGQFVLINGQLYKVTSAIASGATFTVGTNVISTTVGTELTALA